MPHNADASVARCAARLWPGEGATAGLFQDRLADAARANRFRHCRIDCVELMVTRHLFRDCRAVVLKHDEMPHEIKKASLIENSAQQNLQLWHRGRRNRLSING